LADRTVKVTLVAQATGYIQGMQAAQKATQQTASEAEKLAQKREAFQTLGRSMVVVGGAITAVGVAALRTGIQYNTLQQTTRAALTTLLGSAEAANAQMDKLDDFARNSPFAKQTFITAQQQMLGFGVAAEDVLPALDAIQNAVAAFGGSNQQISAIAEIMSRIKSEGRLSGDALQRLGYYGIDAAQVIGSQMGKTSAEIRDMASKPGGIPVDQIWDPLVNGLQEKFGGAADNVKQTFAGAMDRMKAAWRDFSSELASPLVDPNGNGGALIDLFNWTADMMRLFLGLPKPVRDTMTAVTLTTGAVLLLGGTALLAIPKVVAFQAALATLGGAGHLARSSLRGVVGFLGGPWGLAITAATIGLGFFIGNAAKTQANIEALSDSLDENTGAFTDNTRAIIADRIVSNDSLVKWADKMGVSLELLTDAAMGSTAAMDEIDRAVRRQQGDNGHWLDTRMVIEDLNGELETAVERNNRLADAMGSSAGSVRDAADAYAAGADAAGAHSAELGVLGGAAKIAGVEVSDLADKVRGFASLTLSAREAQRAFEESLDNLTDSVATNGATLDVTTAAGRANERAIDDLARKTLEHAAATWEQTGSQDEATAALQRGRDELVEQLAQFGITGQAAEDYADQLGLIPENISTVLELLTSSAVRAAEAFVAQWQGRRVTMDLFLDSTNGDRSAAAAAARYTAQAQAFLQVPGRARGGDLDSAPGPIGRDSKLFWGAKGEHVFTAAEVARMGGQSAVYAFRRDLMRGTGSAATTPPSTRMVAPSSRAVASTIQVAPAPAQDRPIYMDGSLFGLLRQVANGEAQIVLNTAVDSYARDVRAGGLAA
jgi:tape measure domain-containing protein